MLSRRSGILVALAAIGIFLAPPPVRSDNQEPTAPYRPKHFPADIASPGAALAATDKKQDPVVVMKTSKGIVKMRIFLKEAPITAGNFMDLVRRGFYNGLTFHRYEPGFVIQGGDPTGTGNGNFRDPRTGKDRLIKLEKVRGLTHDAAGMVAMARSNDPDSASCQFYITLAPAAFLDNPPGYAVFGKAIDGMDAVLKLRAGDKITTLMPQ
jgi:peptidyl-prolyl cis-trans isomerase B (cyclophilin B)